MNIVILRDFHWNTLRARPWKMAVGGLLCYWEGFSGRIVKLGGALYCTWMRMDCDTKSPSCVTVGQTKAGACETTKLCEVVS